MKLKSRWSTQTPTPAGVSSKFLPSTAALRSITDGSTSASKQDGLCWRRMTVGAAVWSMLRSYRICLLLRTVTVNKPIYPPKLNCELHTILWLSADYKLKNTAPDAPPNAAFSASSRRIHAEFPSSSAQQQPATSQRFCTRTVRLFSICPSRRSPESVNGARAHTTFVFCARLAFSLCQPARGLVLDTCSRYPTTEYR